MKTNIIFGYIMGALTAIACCGYFVGKYRGQLESAEYRVIAAECYYTSRDQQKTIEGLFVKYESDIEKTKRKIAQNKKKKRGG